MEPLCSVCLAAHDPEIHEATLRIHRWFRSEIRRMQQRPPKVTKRGSRPPIMLKKNNTDNRKFFPEQEQFAESAEA